METDNSRVDYSKQRRIDSSTKGKKPQCAAKTKKKRRCKHSCITASKYCRVHHAATNRNWRNRCIAKTKEGRRCKLSCTAHMGSACCHVHRAIMNGVQPRRRVRTRHDSEVQRFEQILSIINAFEKCSSKSYALRLGRALTPLITYQFQTISDHHVKIALVESLSDQLYWCSENRDTMEPFYDVMYTLQMRTVSTWNLDIIRETRLRLTARMNWEQAHGQDTKKQQQVIFKLQSLERHT